MADSGVPSSQSEGQATHNQSNDNTADLSEEASPNEQVDAVANDTKMEAAEEQQSPSDIKEEAIEEVDYGELTDLSYVQVKKILGDCKHYLVDEIPQTPSAGTLYCVDTEKIEDWRNDGYHWKRVMNIEHKDQPDFHVETHLPLGCDVQKIIYSSKEIKPHIAVIQYCNSQIVKKDEKERKTRKGLSTDEAYTLLHNCEGSVSASRAIRPKAGEIYMFDTEQIGDDWKCDDYVWRNCGTAFVPSKAPTMKKTFFSIRTPKTGDKGSMEFQKVAYRLLERPNIVMVYYMGDESVFVPMRHGNRKRGDVEHKRTCPSVLEKIKQGVKEGASVEHFRWDANCGADVPRNNQQISNLKSRVLKKRQFQQPRTELIAQAQEAVEQLTRFEDGGRQQQIQPAQQQDVHPSPEKRMKFFPGTMEIKVEEGLEDVIQFDENGQPKLPPGYELVHVNVDEDSELLSPSKQPVEAAAAEAPVQDLQHDDGEDDNDAGFNPSGDGNGTVTELPQEQTQTNAAQTSPQNTTFDLMPDVSQLQREILAKQKNILMLQQEKARLESEVLEKNEKKAIIKLPPAITEPAQSKIQYIIQNPQPQQTQQVQIQTQPTTQLQYEPAAVNEEAQQYEQTTQIQYQEVPQYAEATDLSHVQFEQAGQAAATSDAVQNVMYVQDAEGREQMIFFENSN